MSPVTGLVCGYAVYQDLRRDLKYILSHDDRELLGRGQNTCRLAAIGRHVASRDARAQLSDAEK